MYYNDFHDLKLSGLGLGCMRLPCIDGDESRPDPAKVQEMIDYAIANGINYFDTAWGYHGGNSEAVIGEALSKHDRSEFYLASKFPGYDRKNFDKKEEIFETQLEKCKTDHFDFYLCHTLTEENEAWYMDDELGLMDYLVEQKKAGRIKHIGFSCHSGFETMHRFVKKYWRHLDFCQIQLNYLDMEFQDAKSKVEYLNNLGMPIWVMEPLRGGKLAQSCLGGEKILAKSNPDFTPANWAFAFLQSVPGVTMILSGMSNMEQIVDNVNTFDHMIPLSETETGLVMEIADGMKNVIPCTACRYCCDGCPMGLNIPVLLSTLSDLRFAPSTNSAMHIEFMPDDKKPSACIACGKCTKICPQGIDIPALMKELTQVLETVPSWAEICRQREEAQKKNQK